MRGACLITLLRSIRPPVEADLTPMRQNLCNYRYIVLREPAGVERLVLEERRQDVTDAIRHAAPDHKYLPPQITFSSRRSMHRPLRSTMCHCVNLFRAKLAISLVLIAMAGSAVAGRLEDAAAAYQRGDYATAMLIVKPLADQGDAVAQYRVGVMYFHGEGASQDYGEAVKWFRKSADQGYAPAQYNVGVMYQRGRGVSRDYAEAVEWFRRAADQGNADAQFNLGAMYRNGQGVSQNYAESFQWYQSAADRGYIKAQLAVASMYHAGQGVPRNDAEALKWFGKVADHGNADAQEMVGFMYLHGKGTAKDLVRAYMWFNLSASLGSKDAEKYRDQTASSMTLEQIAKAQMMARDWKPQPSPVARGDDEVAPLSVVPTGNPHSQRRVPMKIDGGVFVVPVEINGIMTLDFAVDSGAAYVSLPADVFYALKRTGTVKDSDVEGQRTYVLADGTKSQSASFTLKSLSVGSMVVENVKANVMPAKGSLLLGQSFLERFKSWSIDNTKHELLLEPQ